jgi:uncharacterized protein with PIN domain
MEKPSVLLFSAGGLSMTTGISPAPAEAPRFICDVHLGTLARRLRLLGFDTVYRNDLEDEEIVRIAVAESRIILTRDGGILRDSRARSYRPDSIHPGTQIKAVVSAFALAGLATPFCRCIACNGSLLPVDKGAVIDRVPLRSGRCMDRFWQCRGCAKLYWQGSHYARLRSWANELVSADLPEGNVAD